MGRGGVGGVKRGVLGGGILMVHTLPGGYFLFGARGIAQYRIPSFAILHLNPPHPRFLGVFYPPPGGGGPTPPVYRRQVIPRVI